jgi:tetratricopeptide (TPR) repeat protein
LGTKEEVSDHKRQLATELIQRAYAHQMAGELDEAIGLYKESIDVFATAEAYTFLGWTYRFQGKLDDAIAECKKAIVVDPAFGNPYNDIGAYLIELGDYDGAIPWLEQATRSSRYESYHYPWYNLGRVYVAKEMYNKGRECFRKALELEPEYKLASDGLEKLRMLLQ